MRNITPFYKRIAALCLALLVLASTGCAPDEPANPNVVEEAVLRPVLLDDRAHMEAYLAAWPEAIYKQYRVDSLGVFYVDNVHDLIKAWLVRGLLWEKHLEELFPRYVKPGSTVIDAGAHIGTHTLALAKLAGPEGRVYAFEPQRKIFRELVYNMRLNGVSNVVPLRFALGDSAGVIEMARATLGNEGATPVGLGGDQAELRSLDSFGFRNVSFMKIDVEGFEDHVLDGARETVQRNRPVILIEIQGGQRYESASSEMRAKIDGTRARLAAMGYKVERVHDHDYLAIPQ